MRAPSTLSVSAIEEGTVIDHISSGEALKIVRLLKLAESLGTVTIGMHLKSQRMGFKDVIKIQGRDFSETEAHLIAFFAPTATINIIKNYEIATKLKPTLPEKIERILICPNYSCITNHEPCPTVFVIKELRDRVDMMCQYCQKEFVKEDIREYKI